MAIKLALIDVDGTLRTEGRWHDGALEFIRGLHAAGIRVALCSGRATVSMQALAADLPELSYLASNGGATVLRRNDAGWEVVAHRALPPEAVRYAVEAAQAGGDEIWAYNSTEWLATCETSNSRHEQSFVDDAPRFTDIAAEPDVAKVLFIIENHDHAERIRARVAVPATVLVQSGRRYLDLLPEVAYSAKGGDVVVELADVGWEEVLAMGDGENDTGMLAKAEVAFAVGGLNIDELPSRPGQIRRHVDDVREAEQVVSQCLEQAAHR